MSRTTTPTYVLLNQITLAAISSSVTFSNIPQNYGDLILVVDGTNSATSSLRIRFNNSTSTYFWVAMAGVGSGSGNTEASSFTAGLPSVITIQPSHNYHYIAQIMDYSAADKHKTTLIRADIPEAGTQAQALRWSETTAISQINLFLDTANYNTGSTFSLYGLVA